MGDFKERLAEILARQSAADEEKRRHAEELNREQEAKNEQKRLLEKRANTLLRPILYEINETLAGRRGKIELEFHRNLSPNSPTLSLVWDRSGTTRRECALTLHASGGVDLNYRSLDGVNVNEEGWLEKLQDAIIENGIQYYDSSPYQRDDIGASI